MCKEFFQGLFGNKPVQQAAVAAPVATAVSRESRKAGQVKTEAPVAASAKRISGGGNTSIGIGIGTPDTPRKRTTELGL